MSEESVKKLRATNIAKYGSYEAWKRSMRERGAKGGKSHNKGGFRDKKLAKRAGRIGGLKRWGKL